MGYAPYRVVDARLRTLLERAQKAEAELDRVLTLLHERGELPEVLAKLREHQAGA